MTRWAQLAQRSGLDQSTLSRNLRMLEADGLIEIAVVETDLRRRAVWLTKPARRGWKRRYRSGVRRMTSRPAPLPDLACRLAEATEALVVTDR